MAEVLLGVNGDIIRWAREYYNMKPEEAATAIGVDLQRYHDRSFVGLQHMETVQFFMEIIIKDSQIPVRTLDHPVRHHLLGNVDVVPQEFLTDPVQRKPVYILGIHDTCRQRRSQDAVPQQISRTVCLNDRLIVPAGIDSYMMLFDCVHSRLKEYIDPFTGEPVKSNR